MMVFPATVLPLLIELQLDGTWTDVTQYVQRRDLVTASRGRADEAGTADPQQLRLSFNNAAGRFSPRNPTGPYYGMIGRNTPLRASVLLGNRRLIGTDPTTTVEASTPDSVATSVLGDIDLRMDVTLPSWREAGFTQSKLGASGNISYLWGIGSDGTLALIWSQFGTTTFQVASTVTVPQPTTGRKAVRVTFDVNNGAGGSTAAFYTSDTINGVWTQLGDPVITAGTTAIFNGTASTVITANPGAKVHAAQTRSGIGGTIVANPDFTSVTEGTTTTFVDSAGATWTLVADSIVTARRYRYTGEVAAWPPKWDGTGEDVWVPVAAAGVLQRLGQPGAAIRSALYRGVTTSSPLPRAYWPGEDGAEATTIASSSVTGSPMAVTGSPTFASFGGFACSAPLPVLNGATARGLVSTYTGTGTVILRLLLAVPAAGDTDNGEIMNFDCTGSGAFWALSYRTTGSGSLRLRATNAAGVQTFDTGTFTPGAGLNGQLAVVRINLVTSGANTGYDVLVDFVGDPASYGTTGSAVGVTVIACTTVSVGHGLLLTGTAVGHVQLYDAEPPFLASEIEAWVGELAVARLVRLTAAYGVTLEVVGQSDPDSLTPGTGAMGAQPIDTLLNVLRQCEAVDGGILYEPRDALGLAYRTYESMLNQNATLALSYTAADLSDLEPVEDDQQVRNDVTATRTGGASYRATLATGALSVLPPPDGVGTYDSAVTVNVETDDQLPDVAGWRLHLGTVDEPRYPTVGLNLARTNFAAAADQLSDALDLDVGDAIGVTGTPVWLPPDGVAQLAQGFTETLGNFEVTIGLACSPGSPWQGQAYDELDAWYESDGSSLHTGVSSSATSLSVDIPSGPLWTHTDGDFDVVMGGERMTVTNVTGGSSPQTFTVTRHVNGVVKAHLAGAAIALFTPTFYTV
jgi:hypothetical protein